MKSFLVLQEMKKIIVSLIILTCCFFEVKSQPRSFSELGLPGKTWIIASAGPSFIFPSNIQSDPAFLSNQSLSLGFRHLFQSNWGYKAALHYRTYKGLDSGSAFQSNLVDGTFQAEYVLWGGPFAEQQNRNTLSVFMGTGYVYNQSTSIKTYNKSFPEFFTGFSYQRNLTRQITLGFDCGINYLMANHLTGQEVEISKRNLITTFEFSITYNINKVPKNEKDCNCDLNFEKAF